MEAGLSPLQAAERGYVELEEEYRSLKNSASPERKEELTTKYQPLLDRGV